jgi:hypothetical protein
MTTATARIRRDAGSPGGYLVESSAGDSWYEVRLAPESCTCKGFEYRGRCKHIGMVEAMFEETPVDLEEPADDDMDADEDVAEWDRSEVTMDENSNPHLAAIAGGYR